MKNKFIYIWGVLFLLALIGIGCIIYNYNKEGKGMDSPQRSFIEGIIKSVDEGILIVEISSEESPIKQWEIVAIRIPEESMDEEYRARDRIKMYYFIPCDYVEGHIWEPDKIVVYQRADVEETTPEPEKVTTAITPKDESNYDSERIKITKWDITQNGIRIPLMITVDDVEYEYTYGDGIGLESIKGSDGTSIELKYCEVHMEETKNGRSVKYFYDYDPYGNRAYDGFEYEGKRYTYQYNIMPFITGVLDENNKLVAEYKYIPKSQKGYEIQVTNHTEDNIGYVNSVRYVGYYYDEVTGFVFKGGEVNNAVSGRYEKLKG